MKIIFTLLLATVFTSAFAYDGGRLTISVASNKNVQVFVDGRSYQVSDNSYVLENIQSGNHTVQVYNSNGRMGNNNGYGNNNRYGRNNNARGNDRKNLIYSSTVYVRPSYDVDVMINRFGKALVDERLIDDRNGNYDGDDQYDGNGGGYDNGGYNNDYNRAMSDAEFNTVIQKIRNQWFGKLGAARDAMDSHYFTSAQAKQVLQLFSSDNDKLELAKLSYKNIVDRQNFRQVSDLLSYQSQIELDKYVRSFRS